MDTIHLVHHVLIHHGPMPVSNLLEEMSYLDKEEVLRAVRYLLQEGTIRMNASADLENKASLDIW